MKRQKVVVKVGSSTLTYADGKLNVKKIKQLVKELSYLSDQGHRVILVSSGAVAAGIGKLELKERPTLLVEKRAVAAIGQVELIHLYENLFFAFDKTIAQLLLTKDDFSHRQRYLNARNMVHRLLEMGVIPVVNENDSVVVDEIKVGDNDSLSAFVAALVDADLLVLVSDIDGLYDRDPHVHEDAVLLKTVDSMDSLHVDAGDAGSTRGTGGMRTKLSAAAMSIENGTEMVICNGSDPHNIVLAVEGEPVGTRFTARNAGMKARMYWLKYATNSDGILEIDAGAREALQHGCSLLAVGIIDSVGVFERGSVVEIQYGGKRVAVGIANYSSHEMRQISGLHSNEIEAVLGYKYEDVVVHIDNMVITE